MRKTKHCGIRGVPDFMLNRIAYNLIRIPKLIAAKAEHAQTAKRHRNDRTQRRKPAMPVVSNASISRFFSGLLNEESESKGTSTRQQLDCAKTL